jgi:hypothetical protein
LPSYQQGPLTTGGCSVKVKTKIENIFKIVIIHALDLKKLEITFYFMNYGKETDRFFGKQHFFAKSN